jgi:hypothetical protein
LGESPKFLPTTKELTSVFWAFRPKWRLPGTLLRDVLDLYVAPLVPEVFGHQAAVTMVWRFLAAQEASTINEIARNGLLDPA